VVHLFGENKPLVPIFGHFQPKTAVFDRIYRIFQDFRPNSLLPQRSQRGKAATKRIGTSGNSQAGKQETQENKKG
jgi:hypothetical protein